MTYPTTPEAAALAEEALKLADVLRGMTECGAAPDDLWERDQPDGDPFVARAAELLRRLAALASRAGQATGGELTDAARDVLAERKRQVEAEGWFPEHDDQHDGGDLAKAAACYAIAMDDFTPGLQPPRIWPWDAEFFKPTTTRRNLVKAGALILAEIERLDRAALAQQPAKEAPTVDAEELKRALMAIKPVASLDGHDVIRRSSVIGIMMQRSKLWEPTPGHPGFYQKRPTSPAAAPAPQIEQPQAAQVLPVREFQEWLDENRDARVHEVFHDIVVNYRAALSTHSAEKPAPAAGAAVGQSEGGGA